MRTLTTIPTQTHSQSQSQFQSDPARRDAQNGGPPELMSRQLMSRRALALAIFGALMATMASPVLSAPKLVLDSVLEVSRDLVVSVEGAQAEMDYKIILVDDVGATVAELDVMTDDEGAVTGEILWSRTGVVPCGCAANPLNHQFIDFDEAALYLVGKVFSVQLRRQGNLWDSQTIDVKGRSTPLHYWSGATGCPKGLFAVGGPTYLSGRYISELEQGGLFLIESPEELGHGVALEEVRPGYLGAPQLVAVDMVTETYLVQVSVSHELTAGDYTAVWRNGSDGEAMFQPGDVGIAMSAYALNSYGYETENHCSWDKPDQGPPVEDP